MSNSSSWPWPSRATTPRTSPAHRSNETSVSLRPDASGCARVEPRDGVGGAALAARGAGGARGPVARRCRRASARRSGPRSPSVTSTTPTVSPSRRTVARSHTAAISISRWEMKMTERSVPRWRPMTSSTRSVRFGGQRRGHLVEHAGRRARSASARARSMTRSDGERQVAGDVARGRGRAMPSSASQWRNGSTRRLGQAQVRRDVEVRDERRLLVDRDDAAAPGLGGGAGDVRLAADEDRAGVGADAAGEDLDQRALAGAVGAHQRVDLAGADGERGGAQRRDRAVALGDAGRLEQQVGAPSITCSRPGGMSRVANGDAGGADTPVIDRVRGSGLARPGPCRR